ncbi:MAG: VWA domain-containing protein [Acidobacteriota bacterium]
MTPRPHTASSAFAALALALACFTPSVEAQDVGTGFFETVEVEVVNVEVFVTDRKGEPISGLTKDDFEITHDGAPVEISNFYAASAAVAADEASAVQRLDDPADDSAVELAPLDQSLNLVIFLDNRNLEPKNRNRVIDALRGSLFFNLKPQDRVTIAAYDGALTVKQGLTGDANKLAEVLDEMAARGATGVFSKLDRLAILRELQQSDLEQDIGAAGGGSTVGFSGGAGADFDGILQQIRAYTRGEYERIGSTVEAMGRFVDTLSGLEGRKALVYVSDGLSLRPGEALYQAFSAKAPGEFGRLDIEAREYDATPLLEKLAKIANASRVTFYSVLAAGASSRGLSGAERTAFVPSTSGSFGDVWNEGLDELERANFRSSMQILAEATGGIATLSTRNFSKALKRVQKDLGTFYSLGYEAPDGEKGKDYRVKVKVKRDGLKVRHRETFRIRSQDEEMQVRTRSALLFDQPKNPLGVLVEFGPPQEDDKGLFLVPLIVKFPLSKIVLAPGEKTHDGKVSIYVGARAVESGGMSPVQKLPAPVSIPNDKVMTALGQVAGYRLMLHLSPGEHSVAVSVRDEVAQVESTALVNFDAAEAAAEAAANQVASSG